MQTIDKIFCVRINFSILLVLLVTLSLDAKASGITVEEGLNRVSHFLVLQDCASALAVLDTLTYDDNTAPHYFYFRGVAEDMCGDMSKRLLIQQIRNIIIYGSWRSLL